MESVLGKNVGTTKQAVCQNLCFMLVIIQTDHTVKEVIALGVN